MYLPKYAIITKVLGAKWNVLERMRYVVHLKNSKGLWTPGQAVVFYDGDYVLGGGTIIGGIEYDKSRFSYAHIVFV